MLKYSVPLHLQRLKKTHLEGKGALQQRDNYQGTITIRGINTDGLSVTMWDRGSQYVGRLKSLGNEGLSVPRKGGHLDTLSSSEIGYTSSHNTGYCRSAVFKLFFNDVPKISIQYQVKCG